MLPGPRLLSYGMEQLLWVCRRHMTSFLYSSDTTVYSRTAMLYLSIALSNITRPHLLCACSLPWPALMQIPSPLSSQQTCKQCLTIKWRELFSAYM